MVLACLIVLLDLLLCALACRQGDYNRWDAEFFVGVKIMREVRESADVTRLWSTNYVEHHLKTAIAFCFCLCNCVRGGVIRVK